MNNNNYLATTQNLYGSPSIGFGSYKEMFNIKGEGEVNILNFMLPYNKGIGVLEVDGTITTFTNTTTSVGANRFVNVIFTCDRFLSAGSTSSDISTMIIDGSGYYLATNMTSPYNIKGLDYGQSYTADGTSIQKLIIDGKIYFKKYIKLTVYNNYTSTISSVTYGISVKLYNNN